MIYMAYIEFKIRNNRNARNQFHVIPFNKNKEKLRENSILKSTEVISEKSILFV